MLKVNAAAAPPMPPVLTAYQYEFLILVLADASN